MARTPKNIYYPYDYSEAADIPEDLKEMAESIDDAIDANAYDDTALKARVTANEGDIADIKSEQTTQNTNIQTNATAIGNLQTTVNSQGQTIGQHTTTIASMASDIENLDSNKEDKSNKVTELTDQSTDVEYPSAKCVYDELKAKQSEIDTLEQDVEDLRNASVKVPGTGTDITLNNTAQARLLKNELGGRTEQESLSGKNLLNVPSIFELNRFNEFPINLEAGSYIISLEKWATSGTNGSSVFNIDGTNYSLNNSNKSITVNLANDITKIYMYSYYDYNSSAGIIATFTNLMIRKANVTDASYEPYCGRNTSTKSYI